MQLFYFAFLKVNRFDSTNRTGKNVYHQALAEME
jgi:hypothetical protein